MSYQYTLSGLFRSKVINVFPVVFYFVLFSLRRIYREQLSLYWCSGGKVAYFTENGVKVERG
jgi:hypothetical protein